VPPNDERSRRLGQPAAPADDTSATRVTDSITDQVNGGADPHAVGELLNTWIGLKMDEVDELVAEAKVKLSTLPSQQVLWECFGEWLLRLVALEREVADLRAEVGRLHKRGRAA